MEPVSHFELELIYSHECQNGEAVDKESTTEKGQEESHSNEKMLLQVSDGKALAKILDAPELVAEVERAVYQVEHLLEQKPKSQ